MKNQFAKLFQLGDYQVLVQREFVNITDEFLLIQSTVVDGLHSTITHHTDEELICDAEFLAYDESKAQAFLNAIITTRKECFDAN